MPAGGSRPEGVDALALSIGVKVRAEGFVRARTRTGMNIDDNDDTDDMHDDTDHSDMHYDEDTGDGDNDARGD